MEKLLKLIKDLTWYNKVEKSKEILRLLTTVFLQDAPEDGNIYGRKDGAWEEVTTGGVVADASPTVKGISKLYNDLLASNTDGGVTQAALVAYLADVLEQDYSADEVNTGVKWIDGKPIYRKVVPFTLPDGTSENTVAFDLSTLNTKIVIKNEAKLFDDNDQWIDEQIKITASHITNFHSRVDFPNILEIAFLSTEIITGNVTVNQAGMSGHVILEYTKTTD